MADQFHKGDEVTWNTSQGPTHGRVEKVVRSEVHIAGTTLKGSADDPVYVVRSDKTGAEAGHKAGGLRKRS